MQMDQYTVLSFVYAHLRYYSYILKFIIQVPCILGINLTHKDLLEYIEQVLLISFEVFLFMFFFLLNLVIFVTEEDSLVQF